MKENKVRNKQKDEKRVVLVEWRRVDICRYF
jgi:hypothetical protein